MSADFEHDVQQFWALLFGMVLEAEKRLSSQLEAHGLTTPQFYVLKTLSERDGQETIGAIARAHGLTNPTMTGLVKRLEAMEPPLVTRATNAADRRSVYVALTDAGRQRFLDVQADLFAQLRALLELIGVDERAELLRYLARYAQIVGALQ